MVSRELKGKMKKGEYPAFEYFEEDIKVMVTNAKTYNQEGSEVYTDAESIWVRCFPPSLLSNGLSVLKYLLLCRILW